jgi:hypothetical protein
VSAERLGEPGVDRASERVGPLGLLASAIASRDLRVSPGQPGEPTWTDGRAIFVDADASVRAQIEAIAVQASLLAAGSLTPDIVRRLRRPALARRYLAIEGHRALSEVGGLLPRVLREMIDPDLAARADSPTASLAAARSRETIADPPERFGAIRTRPLLASLERAERSAAKRTRAAREAVLAELDEDDAGAGTDAFSSPVGGGGVLGRLLGRMLRPVRQLGGGGPPGADAATHRTQTATRTDRAAVVSIRAAETAAEATGRGSGTRYPEWDVQRRRYRPDWCTVYETLPRSQDAEPFPIPDPCGLRRPLARLGMGLDACHRQAQGDDIDIDAAVEARVAAMAGSRPDEAVYLDSLRTRRDLAVLLLLDTSGSTAEPAASGETVHQQQRGVAAALTAALHEIGDRVALYAFHSQGRNAVHLAPVKRFDDDLDAPVMRRLGGLVPGAYSRLGAAIRHATAVLNDRGGTSRRLLVVLSDGLAYDHGYEPAYGAADARRALSEARSQGVGCLCLTLGAGTDVGALRRVFGSAAHATIERPAELRRVIGPLFRSALRSAEVRRRVSR